ncbi:phosphatidylserine/phosphatidylglycerophosphate/cardiolipin synthase family protein [Candidatus Saccharibacteria bacterium]|nr:phosphatidylserine/phosphatidylglycerophosphate/cardiolipin synthase family protein [Candidatus Saccharibacteria bacterium]
MSNEDVSKPKDSDSSFNSELTDSLAKIRATNNEIEKQGNGFELQSPQEFRDDFSALAQYATDFVGIETMQFEVTQATIPIFNALKAAKVNGAKTRFVYDRVAREHVRSGNDQAWSKYGKTVYKGNKSELQQAINSREQQIAELEELGITHSSFRDRGENERGSHNHIKLAIVDDVAWFGTMNLRQVDFEMSNFMIKVTNPKLVEVLKEIFLKTEPSSAIADEVFVGEEHGLYKDTQLLVDGGEKGESVIYDKALEMAKSLGPEDEFIMINQWPPAKTMFGEIADVLQEKIEAGSTGLFLLSPKEYYHPLSKKLGTAFQVWLNQESKKSPNFNFKNLVRPTHAKAFVIKRADGDIEVLFGSHNFAERTVNNGTKELAMWSKDPEIVGQIMAFLEKVQAEK